ncbi:guanylate-binding protein 7-like isoform X2 [Clavelina lepadiformis]
MRQGKSFLLNLFLRYLQSKRSDTWLHDENHLINKGFGWRGGQKKCTEGIWIWTEPFHVETKEGSLVIFLMDTQGTFDHETSIKGCSWIFALSTLISSVQIFNIMRQINESHLQHLQLFAEYGKMARKGTNTTNEKDFQHLMFLVRDSFVPDHFGLEAGRSTLEDILKVRHDHEDLRSVRQNLLESFKKVDCCLLPKPGDKVEVMKAESPPLKRQDVSQQFLVEVGKLAQYLFKENLSAKRVNGCKVTGGDLINLIIAYCRVFESGNMPEIQPILEASAQAAMLTLIQQCKSDYKETMEEICGTNYVRTCLIQEIHGNCKEGILINFDQKPKLGNGTFIIENRQILSDQIDQIYDTIEQINLTKKEQIKASLRKCIAEAEDKFISFVSEKVKGQIFMKQSALNCILQDGEREVSKSFIESTRNYDQELVEEHKKRICQCLVVSAQQFTEANSMRKVKYESELASLAISVKKAYTDFMDQKCEGKFLETSTLESVHVESMQLALAKFQAHKISPLRPMNNTFEEKRFEVETELSILMQRYVKSNETNRILINGKILDMMSRVKEIYNNQMAKECGARYATAHIFERAHEESKKVALSAIRLIEREEGKAFAEKCLAEIGHFLNVEKQKFERKNEEYKAVAVNEFKTKANTALRFYSENIEKNKNIYVIDDNFERNHNRFRSKALCMYTSMGRIEPSCEYERILEELSTAINTQYQLAKQRNCNNKQVEIERAEQLLQELKAAYMKHMQQLCDGVYVDPDVLYDKHQTSKKLILERFEKQTKGFFPAMLERCDKEMEAIYESVKSNNENNKPNVLRKVANVISAAADGALLTAFLAPTESVIGRVKNFVIGGLIGAADEILD